MQGVQSGAGMQQLQLQQQQQQLAAQQQQAAAAQQQQMNADMGAVYQNPTPDAIARMTLKYPQLTKQFKDSYDMLDSSQKQSNLENMTRVGIAIQSNRMDVATKLMQDQADALRNSGREHEAAGTEAMLKVFQTDPALAKISVGKMLATMAGPEKYAATMAGIGTEQRAQDQSAADLALKQAQAKKAGAEATVAAGTVPALIQKPIEDNLTAQTKRKVDEFNAQIAGADSETKRGQLVLERDKFIAEQAKTAGVQGADTQNQMDTLSQSITTVKALKDHPGLSSGTGAGGDFRAWFNSTDAKDFRAMAETVKSQQFLTQAKEMKGMGALSDAEGARIEKAVSSLDFAQSTKQFKNALGVIQTTLEKGQAKLIASGKLPKTGGAFVMDHPTMGKVTEGDINRLLVQHPGATREQVIQFLNSSTGGASGNY